MARRTARSRRSDEDKSHVRRTRRGVRESLRRTGRDGPQHRHAARRTPRPGHRAKHAAGVLQRQRRAARDHARRPSAACAATRAPCTRAACACRASSSGPPSYSRASTSYPACTMDLFPDRRRHRRPAGDVMVQPLDGMSLKPLFTRERRRSGTRPSVSATGQNGRSSTTATSCSPTI